MFSATQKVMNDGRNVLRGNNREHSKLNVEKL